MRTLSANALAALPYLFEFWARPGHQLPPDGDWTTWVVMGGRGAGKTRAGAEWLRAQAEGATPDSPGAARRIALVAQTWEQAREVMVFGDSGIMACSPPDRRPAYLATRRKLVWQNGAEAQLFSAADRNRCAARSSTRRGATSWRNGARARRRGTCSSSACGWGRIRVRW